MGVNLTPVVVRHPTTLAALRGRTVAVDGNLELYQFLSVVRLRDGRPLMDAEGRVTSHLSGLVFRTTRLITNFDIRPVFVFDGPPPALKHAEIKKRREARARAQQQYHAAVAAGDLGTAWSKAVTSTRLTRAMVDDAKRLLTLLGIPWVQAPSEGEAEAAFLAQRGDVWAAASKDYDSLLFGAPRLVRFLAVGSSEFLPSVGRARAVPPEVLDLEENLRDLHLTRAQLVDAAILVGTDFFEGVEGIGPKTAVKRMREWGTLDAAPPEIRPLLPRNLDEIRSFYLEPPVVDPGALRASPVKATEVMRFLCDERGFSAERVRPVIDRLQTMRSRASRLDDYLAGDDSPEG